MWGWKLEREHQYGAHFLKSFPTLWSAHCRGLAQQHGRYHFLYVNGYQVDTQIIDHLLTLWQTISEFPRFKIDDGQSFVFWLPHSNTFYDHLLWTGEKVSMVHFSCCPHCAFSKRELFQYGHGNWMVSIRTCYGIHGSCVIWHDGRKLYSQLQLKVFESC